MAELPPDLTQIEVIRENQRFSTYQATYRDQQAFVKCVSIPELALNIRREINGLELFGSLTNQYDAGFAVPRILLESDYYIVTSWAQGEPMSIDYTGTITGEQVEFFATLFTFIDRHASDNLQSKVVFDLETKNADESVAVLGSRLHRAHLPSYVSSSLINQALAFVNDSLGALEARLAHADTNPGNILESNGVRTLLDYEFVSDSWPRFYDLVNLTSSRMILFPGLIQGMKQIVNRYFEVNNEVDVESQKDQLNTVAMYRALSLIWELSTEPSQYHNTGQSMTPEVHARISQVMTTILGGNLYAHSPLESL